MRGGKRAGAGRKHKGTVRMYIPGALVERIEKMLKKHREKEMKKKK